MRSLTEDRPALARARTRLVGQSDARVGDRYSSLTGGAVDLGTGAGGFVSTLFRPGHLRRLPVASATVPTKRRRA
jgi:hypothetical protein